MVSSYKVVVAISAFCVLLSGCVMEDRAEMEKTILQHDSSFQEILDQRDAYQRESDSAKAAYIREYGELEDKISELRNQIAAIREQEANLKLSHLASLDEIKRKIYPRKRALKQDLAEMQRRLKRREVELRDIDKDIAEVEALVDKKERLSLTREEIHAWNKRFSSLVERKAEIEKEVEETKRNIEITRLKVKVLVVN